MSADLFLDAESGIESNQPREFYDILQSSAVRYQIASGTRDIAFPDGFFIGSVFHFAATFTAFPMARTEITVNTTTNDGQLTLALPLSHPLAQRWTAQASPPRQVTVTIYRQQLQNGLVEQIKQATIVSMAMEGHLAKFLLASPLARLLSRKLPVLNADPLCEHILYDKNCRAIHDSFSLGVAGSAVPSLTVAGFDGRVITISSIGGKPDHWAQFGDLVHLPTGEKMSILEQVGTTVTMKRPIPDLKDGDQITVSAGCARDITTCFVKFNNQVNFSGFPQLPTVNPFTPSGLGVVDGNS